MADEINHIQRVDGTLLLVFRELLRHRRARDAAQALGMSPSAISHALTRLRTIFDDPLFVRRAHGLEPTVRAIELQPRLERLIAAVSDLMVRNGGLDAGRRDRRFRFAAPDFVLALIAAPLLEILNETSPRTSFEARQLGGAEPMAAVAAGELDFAIGPFPHVPAPLVRERLYEDLPCVVARQGNPGVAEKLRDDEVIRFDRYWSAGSSQDFAEAGAMTPWFAAILVVSLTDQVAVCPARTAARLKEVMPLQITDPPFRKAPIEVFSVRGPADDPALAWFLEMLKRAAEAPKPAS